MFIYFVTYLFFETFLFFILMSLSIFGFATCYNEFLTNQAENIKLKQLRKKLRYETVKSSK